MSKIKGYFSGAVSAITYGLIPLFSFPVIAEGMRFESILFYRFLIASILIGSILYYKKEKLIPSSRDLLVIVILGLLYCGSSMFLFWSFSYLSGGVAATIMFMYPVFVALIMNTVFKEKISLLTIIAIGVAISGVFILYIGDNGISLNLLGVILALISGFSYGMYMIVVNKNKRTSTMSGLRITFYACVVSTIFFLFSSLFKGGLQAIPSFEAGLNLSLLGIIPTALSCITLAIAVKIIGSTTTSVLGSLEPVSAVVCGILFLGEPFGASLAWGILMIIISVLLIVIDKTKDRIKGKFIDRTKIDSTVDQR